MRDLISRAAAQTELQLSARRYTVAHEAHGEGRVVWSEDLISVSDAMDVLRKIPSAQPTFDARDTQYNLPIGTDCISRQAAIDFINAGHLCNPNEPRWSDNEVVNFLKSRPPAQPERTPMQELLDVTADRDYWKAQCHSYEMTINRLTESAQPKRGKWILDRSGAYCCSECMEPCAGYVMMKPRDKFCKMCGSYNGGEKDE